MTNTDSAELPAEVNEEILAQLGLSVEAWREITRGEITRTDPGEPLTFSAETWVPALIVLLMRCVKSGMQPPLVACVASPSGNAMVVRHQVGNEWEILTQHSEVVDHHSRYTVLNVMVTDQAGETAQLRLTVEGLPVWPG